MAEEQRPPIILSASHILGIIQRNLMELHAYCGQQPQAVDPQVLMAALEETASFVGRLIQPTSEPQFTRPDDEARVN